MRTNGTTPERSLDQVRDAIRLKDCANGIKQSSDYWVMGRPFRIVTKGLLQWCD